jgi:hypothetical protein
MNRNGERNGVFVSSASAAAIGLEDKKKNDPNYGKPGYVWDPTSGKLVHEYVLATRQAPRPSTTTPDISVAQGTGPEGEPEVTGGTTTTTVAPATSQFNRAKATDPNRNNPNYEWNEAQAKYVRKATTTTTLSGEEEPGADVVDAATAEATRISKIKNNDPNKMDPRYVWNQAQEKYILRPSAPAVTSPTAETEARAAGQQGDAEAETDNVTKIRTSMEVRDGRRVEVSYFSDGTQQVKYLDPAPAPTTVQPGSQGAGGVDPEPGADEVATATDAAKASRAVKVDANVDPLASAPSATTPAVTTPPVTQMDNYLKLAREGKLSAGDIRELNITEDQRTSLLSVLSAAGKDPNEGRSGFYQNPFNANKWEAPPANPYGGGGQFDPSTWSWKRTAVTTPGEEEPEAEVIEEAVTDANAGKSGYYQNPLNYNKWELPPPNPHGEGATFDQTTWQWKPPAAPSGASTDQMSTWTRLINEGMFTEGDIRDLDLTPEQRQTLTSALSAKRQADADAQAEADRIERERLARENQFSEYLDQASTGQLTLEQINALGLDQESQTILTQAYNAWVKDEETRVAQFDNYLARARSGELSLEDINGLGLGQGESTRLVRAYNEGVREREGAEAAAEIERVNSEIERYKNILRENPDVDININKIFANDPEVAKAINAWMGGEEYTRLTSGLGMAGGGEAVDDAVDDGTGDDAVAEETTESFLSRMPAVPTNLGNVEAALWLQDQEGVSPEDVQRWAEWAQQTNRTALVDDDSEVIDETEEVEDGVSPLHDLPWETTGVDEVDEVVESDEEFLGRMPEELPGLDPTFRRQYDNEEDALSWLTAEGLTDVDAKRWLQWAVDNNVVNVEGLAVDKEEELVETDDEALARFSQVTDTLPPGTIRTLIQDTGFTEDQVRQAGSLFRLGGELDFVDGEKAFNGYVEAVQAGTEQEWLQNFEELMSNRGYDLGGELITADPLYTFGTPENEAAIDEVDMEELMLRLPEPPVELELPSDKWFWMLDQVDADGNPVLSDIESMAYYKQLKDDWDETNANTSVGGKGGLGDASDPANLESIQSTIATEIEKTVQDMGFNSEEYKASQTTALEDRYQDARVRLGRQFGIDPGGPKTGRAQRSFEILESQRIQDLSALDSEVQDRVQAARDSTITNLVNAFSSITTGKISEAQLDEQQRQFNTELRESVRQFNKDIAIRLKEFGLNETEVEAAISKINSDIVNNTRAISADISQAWAEVTGELSVPGGTLSLEDLGIPESEWSMFPYLPPSEDMKNSIRMSFEAMLGREMSDGELNNLLANGRISVEDSMPTQRAKEFAATVMQQNMDRVSRYDAIAEENQLDRDKFTEAKDQADKEWNRLNLQVAEEFGLDSNTFRNSMWDLDQRLSKIFFNEEYTEVERDRARRGAINAVSRAYFPDQQGAFLQAKDQYDVLYGDRERAVANAFGMDAETFARASRQADTQEQRYLDVWTSLLAEVETETMAADSEWRERYEEEMADPEARQSMMDRARGLPLFGPFVEAVFPDRDITATEIDFTWEGKFNQSWLGGIEGVVKSLGAGTAGLYIPGAEINPSQATNWFLDNASEDTLEILKEAFNLNLPSGAIQNEDTLRRNIYSYFDALKDAPAGEKPGPFSVSYVSGDWFGKQDKEIQSAIMALLGTTNFSPERSQPGGSALSSIGRLIGAGVGGYAGYKLGGPEGMKVGLEGGADVGGELLN